MSIGNPVRVLRSRHRRRSGWNIAVVSVVRNVNQTVLGIRRRSDAQNIVVEFTLKYERAGSGNSQALLNQIRTVGASDISYAPKHLVLAKSDEAPR